MNIKFKNIASNLGTRTLGSEIRLTFSNSLKPSKVVVFDFEGVDTISNCFADECFAKLLFDHELDFIKKSTTFKNTSPFISQTIAFAFKQRLGQMLIS